jgi:CRISPR-associated protein Cmr6
MTPHYGPYYQRGENPGDWFNPVPIPFLTIAPGQDFLFAVAPRRPKTQEADTDLQLIEDWLESALDLIGAGAKTAVGYGRFVRDLETEQKYKQLYKLRSEEEQKKQFLAAMSPLRREMEEEGYSTNADAFMERLTKKWLPRLESIDEPEERKKEIASHLAQWYRQYKPDQWQKPNKKNEAKIGIIRYYLGEEQGK